MDGGLGGGMNAPMDGWMDGWMGRWRDECLSDGWVIRFLNG